VSTLSPRSRPSQIKSDSNRRLLPPLTRQKVILRASLFVFIVATVWAWTYIGIDITVFVTGFGDIARLLEYMLPPRFDDFNQALDLTFQTLWMAVLGTFLSRIALRSTGFRRSTEHLTAPGHPGSSSRHHRVHPSGAGFGLRADLRAGLGYRCPRGGARAWIPLDRNDRKAPRRLHRVNRSDAAGGGDFYGWASRPSGDVSLVPQIIPAFIGIVLYRLDINLRSATVLGLVGAGGVGLLLKARLGMLEYGEALGVVVIIIVFITVMEFLSAAVRGLLLGNDNISGVAKAPRFSLGNQVYSLFTRKGSRNAQMASSTESR